jgi:hypothetical protein
VKTGISSKVIVFQVNLWKNSLASKNCKKNLNELIDSWLLKCIPLGTSQEWQKRFYIINLQNMKYKKWWFTLVEVMIWIMISVVLMAWVSVFVVNGLSNITLQRDLIKNYSYVSDFSSEINGIFSSNYLNYIDISSSSWFLLRKANTFWKWNFAYVWLETSTWDCVDWSKTKHLKILNFIPFERDDFDIFSSNSFTWWKVSWNWSDVYMSDVFSNNVYLINWTTKTLQVWKSIYWSEIWSNWTSTYLNYPTWLAYWNWKVFISDTWNNRILYLSWTSVYTLLDVSDGILEPTWLYYDSWILYIVNAWKWEILSYSSNTVTSTWFSLSFTPSINLNAVKNFKFYFKDSSWNTLTMTSPTSSWSFAFTNITKTGLDIVTTWSYINYFLSWWVNLTSWTNYSVNISNIAWNLSSNWNYYIELNTDWITPQKYYFPFLTKGTWDITSNKWQNILKILTWWLSYPTWIYSSWANIVVNDFLKRNYIKIDKTWTFVSSWALSSFNFSNISQANKNVRVSDFVLKDFNYAYTWWLLNLKISYYKNFNCEDNSQNILKTLIFKVKPKN